MKKVFLFILLCFLIIMSALSAKDVSINSLSGVEVSSELVPQITLLFSQPLYFERALDKEKMSLDLSFPGMTLRDFEKSGVVAKLKGLKGIIKDVSIVGSKVPSPRVILKIVFAQKDLLIRWSKLDDPIRLIFSIHSKSDLRKIKNQVSGVLYAQNDSMNGQPVLPGKKKTLNQIRIVIDAGHGGKDPGAKGLLGINEKNINLDVARKAKNILTREGYRVFLTRNSDQDLSLLERSELAAQLKADLFVSVHANSARGVQSLEGLETYYLRSNDLFSTRSSGFLFLSDKQDSQLAKLADNLLLKNIDLSKRMANNIQNGVINSLKKRNVTINNRGVKQSDFRVLLRSGIPATLVEVGFVTNKKEATRLSNPGYRQILAEGISVGIKDFVRNNF